MFASWPMVFGALIAGVLVGILVPSPKPPAATSSQATSVQKTSDQTEAKAKRDLAATASKESGAANETTAVGSVATPTTDVKAAKRDATPCGQQTWPYYTPSCIDRSAPAPSSIQVTNTRPADPSIALRDQEKKQASAPEIVRDAPSKATTAAPAQPAVPAQATSSPAPAQSQTPTRAPTPANPRVPDNAQASSADVERQIEQPRQRQQPRGQPRYTRIEPPDNDDASPRVFFRGDGTRVYVMPEGRNARPINGYWRSW
jgi:hypothetical protein